MNKGKSGFYVGEYIVENREKYVGNKNPVYRSSWESRFCYFCDHSPSIKKWGFECLEIPYLNVIDKKVHRYYPDFYFEEVDKNGNERKFVIEVKPVSQTKPPKKPKNNNRKARKSYIYEAHTYVINRCKWEAARDFCAKRGLEFKIITERELFNK